MNEQQQNPTMERLDRIAADLAELRRLQANDPDKEALSMLRSLVSAVDYAAACGRVRAFSVIHCLNEAKAFLGRVREPQ